MQVVGRPQLGLVVRQPDPPVRRLQHVQAGPGASGRGARLVDIEKRPRDLTGIDRCEERLLLLGMFVQDNEIEPHI